MIEVTDGKAGATHSEGHLQLRENWLFWVLLSFVESLADSHRRSLMLCPSGPVSPQQRGNSRAPRKPGLVAWGVSVPSVRTEPCLRSEVLAGH